MILQVQPHCGLANRLRAIISSMEYCRINNFKLNIFWDYFYILFPDILKNSIFTAEKADRFIGPLCFPIVDKHNNFADLPGNTVEYYTNCFPFSELFQMLIPNHKISKIINTIDQENNLKEGFGVHFRSTDFPVFCSMNKFYYTTLQDYVNKIDDLLNTENSFYFSSCDHHAHQKIKNRYGSRAIIVESKNTNTNENEHYDYGYIDMVLLSKTKFILGNDYSTFSHHASLINNTALYCYNGVNWKLKQHE